jgi:hypothetical protein
VTPFNRIRIAAVFAADAYFKVRASLAPHQLPLHERLRHHDQLFGRILLNPAPISDEEIVHHRGNSRKSFERSFVPKEKNSTCLRLGSHCARGFQSLCRIYNEFDPFSSITAGDAQKRGWIHSNFTLL